MAECAHQFIQGLGNVLVCLQCGHIKPDPGITNLCARITELETDNEAMQSNVADLILERNRYRDALEQIRDAPHAPDAWIVAATALMPEPPEARDESHP